MSKWLGLLCLISACASSEPSYFDQCDEGAPDAACYAARRNPDSADVELALQITERYQDLHPPESLPFDWEVGIMMFGFHELYRVTGKPELRDYADAWFKHHADGHRIVWSDSCPPALTALALMETREQAPYAPVVEDVLRYVREEVPRTSDGGISHMGTVFPETVTLWVDSLFMVGMVLTRYTERFEDRGPLDEMQLQLGVFADRLQVPDGWFIHAENWLQTPEPVFWARGNSWITIAGAEYLRVRMLRGESDPRAETILSSQATAILETQDPSGLWWTVADRPGETYLETSGSALFAYGLARGWRYGQRPESGVLEAVHRTKQAVLTRTAEDAQGRPVVTGTSIGTSPGDFDYYAGVAQEDDVPFGVGAVILLLIESSGLPHE